jgi:hypothetical protein
LLCLKNKEVSGLNKKDSEHAGVMMFLRGERSTALSRQLLILFGSGYEPRHRQEQKLNIFIRLVVILRRLKVLSRKKLNVDNKSLYAKIQKS